MIKFTLLLRRNPRDGDLSVELEAPALPRVGDHISHDKSGIGGYVNDVTFWWDEKGKLRNIEVAIKGANPHPL
jgi:hypothetical protein